jgi:hypothetical protein
MKDQDLTASPAGSPPREDGATHCYIGRKNCGCWVAACVDRRNKETSKSVSGFISEGLIVDRAPIDQARLKLQRCECLPAAQRGEPLGEPSSPSPGIAE